MGTLSARIRDNGKTPKKIAGTGTRGRGLGRLENMSI